MFSVMFVVYWTNKTNHWTAITNNLFCVDCFDNYDFAYVQSNLSYPDSCYLGTSFNQAADLLYFMLTLQKL